MAEGKVAIAHVRKDADGNWAIPHDLDEHLTGTATLAAQFASHFDSGEWAYAAGLAHDTHKASAEWQDYLVKKSGFGFDEDAHLETIPGKQDHSTPSAKLAEEIFGKAIGRIISYCIAGHHTGLPDWFRDAEHAQAALEYRISRVSTAGIPDKYRAALIQKRPTNPPWRFAKEIDISLWIRFLFSCLVDADFLDTENYMQPEHGRQRGRYLDMNELLLRLNTFIDELAEKAAVQNTPSVHQMRQIVLANCRAAAQKPAGIYSLTVPTGGGKTLSSLAFALEHAVTQSKQRVIYVIPYTSIIEQTADIFRTVLGDDQVVEHHSNIADDDFTTKGRLASENWDAPVVVTTSVQFFESLFAAKPSRCRKLHNIANSVVILDEAQLVPSDYLSAILQSIQLLREHYKVTLVICTATQPSWEKQDSYSHFPGLPKGSVTEIIQDVPKLYHELKRVDVTLFRNALTTTEWNELANDLTKHESVLCIVSDRKSCRELHRLMPTGTYHLSALMCAQHRSEQIAEIKARLKAGDPTRVISTQLVEAGVDIDFPVVYRALAGLDSIAQAAGRCNREGKLNATGKLGQVIVFVPPRRAPAGILRKASETAARLFGEGLADPIDQSVFAPYFAEIYWKANSLDSKNIIAALSPDTNECGIQFRTAANNFKIIDDGLQNTIVVPYGNGKDLIRLIKEHGPDRSLVRKLQRFAVTVYQKDFSQLLDRGSIEELAPGVFSLICDIEYDKRLGLLVADMPTNPENYIW